MREKVREEGLSEAAVCLGSHLDRRAGNSSKVIAQIYPAVIGIHPSFKDTKQSRCVRLAKSVRSRTGRLRKSQVKKRKKNGDKSAVAVLKDARQLGYVFQDVEPPKPSWIFSKSTKVFRPIKLVQFTKATLHHVNIREEIDPSLGKMFVLPILVSVVRTHQNSRIGLKKRRRDKSDAPAEMRGDWPNVSLSSKRRMNLRFSHLPKYGVSLRHLTQNRRKENLL